MRSLRLIIGLFLLLSVSVTSATVLEEGFKTPPDSAKPWTYWWWLDSNVSKVGITADLEAMKQQGIAGALVFDAGMGGPLAPDGSKFMSPRWREHLKFALQEADRLGMQISLNLCSGWNAGGPWVKPEHAAKTFVSSETTVQGGKKLKQPLSVPTGIKGNTYRDSAVLAFRISERERQAISTLTAGSSYPKYPPALALDGDRHTRWISNGDKPGQGPTPTSPEFLNWEFPAAFPAASLVVTPYPDCGPKDCELQYSDDGKTFQTICRFVVQARQEKTVAFGETEAKFFRLVFTSSYPFQGKDSWNVQVSEVALLQKGQKTSAPQYRRRDAVDVTSNVDASGTLVWDAPEGVWKILRMGYTRVGRGVVHCTSPGGGGLEIDPLSREAMDMHFEATLGACVTDMGKFMGKTLKYTHIDSWELGVPNWTDEFRLAFRHRRGYDPLLYFPALAGKIVDSQEISDRFLHDCRRTAADCIAENYYGRLSELSRKHGMGIHPESGGPFFTHWIDALQCLGKSDIPMGEYWARQTEPAGPIWYRDQFNRCDTVRQAATAAHIYGKKFVQAEAYTTMGPNWEKDPYMLKDVGDLAFCAGLTRNMLCFYVHQPYLDIRPGNQWEAAGTHFDRNITWFPQSHAWLKYLARCQFMLQQGLFVADVCYYYGENVPGFVPGRDHMNPALPRGYDCDTINAEVLLTRVSAQDGRIVLPDGMSYRMLVLPSTDAMSIPVLKKVTELAQAGVTVVGPQPTRTPGLRDYPASDEEVKQLASKLKLVSSNNLQEALAHLGIDPDFDSTAVSLHYIHRRSDDADIYFVSNQQNKSVSTECTFRSAGRQPEIWDAVTGEIRNATAFEIAGGRCTLPLEFPARGSLFVIFRKTAKSVKGTDTANFAEKTQLAELTGPWTVKFDPKWGGPESVVFEKLDDWTQREEPGVKFYSGKATYYKTFDLPDAAQGPTKRVYLDLKRVRNVAQVRLNGKDLGVVWTAPWQVDITQAVKATGNRLEIDVINLWPNRLIGDAPLPPGKRLTKTNVQKFHSGKHKPLPSGLLGPVQLLLDSAVRGTSAVALKYRDGRPAAILRMDARDHGIVLRYGGGPSQCDMLGARDVWVFEDSGTFYMHYDAAGPKGWLCSLAVSKDLLTWEKKGPILDFGKPGEDDSAGACYGVTYKEGDQWHMFYLGTPNASAPPALVPSFPYLTMKARANSPAGPWTKQKDIVPFYTKPGTYYSHTASPGHVIQNGDEYLQFFSSTTRKPGNPCPQRTLGIARTMDLNGPWTVDPHPMVPIEEQIENSTLYYEESNKTWFLFTNHIGIDKHEYTDAIWVYWSKDLNQWDPKDKAVVLDGRNCTWSSKCIGLPSVVQSGDRLALFYDGPGGDSTSHMKRHIGLAFLDLPLSVPKTDMSIKVANLRCEYLENPLGIDQTKPRLSWKLKSSRRGQKQTAYRVLVASSRDKLDKNIGDLWDSGRVESDQSIHVAYNGEVLKSRMECFWKVAVWDKDSKLSDWSEPAEWSMGLLHPEDWKGQWIGVTAPLKPKDVTVTKATYQTLDASVVVDVTAIVKRELAKDRPLEVHYKTLGGDPARGVVKELVVEYVHQGKAGVARAKDFETFKWAEAPTSPYYRQSFHIDDLPEGAMIYLAPLGYFGLYVNGQKVGDEVLAPAVSNFSKRSYYRTYDVAAYLKKGLNSLGIWMGTGWYSPGLPGVKHDSPVVRAQLELSGKGEEQVIVTDTAWQTKPSERTLLGQWRWGKFGGERVDVRKLDGVWWHTEKSTSGWAQVVEVHPAEAPCTAQTCAGNIQLAPIAPRSVERLDKDTILVDFGTNLTGLMNMSFRGLKPGQKVTLYYADLDGRPEEDAWRAKQTRKQFAVYGQFDEFISAGTAEEQFKNIFNYHAFRYVLIEGLGYVPKKSDMAVVPVETEVAEAGTFNCSNDLYKRIHKMVRWTYRCLNLGGQTVDCPHRERLGYGDGQTIMDTGLFNFDAASLYAKWSRNWWDEQKEDGYVPFTAPCPHGTGGGPAWGAMCIMVPWKTYLFSNDRRLLQEGYPVMKKYMDYLSAHCEDGILQEIFPDEKWPNLGDWVPPRRGMDTQNWPDKTMRLVFNNCYRVHLLQIMQRVAGLLGKDADADQFARDMRLAQGEIHQTFFDPKNNTYANGEQPYLIFPLKTGVTPAALRDAVFERYVETLLVKDKGHLNTGMIGTQIVTDYLLEINRNDLIDAFVNKTTYPGWGYMVEQGATTCWEQWNGYFSQIHSCFPYISGWFYRGLTGIRWDPDAPGFEHVILRPAVVKSVDWVKCSYESPYGEIVSDWKLGKGSFLWNISLPVNSAATVYVPAEDVKGIKEGGKTIAEARGVTFLRMEAGSAVLHVESGTYDFVSRYHRGNQWTKHDSDRIRD